MNLGFGVGLWQHHASGGGPNPPGPIPGPLDFGSGALDQTSYTTEFDVAAPHVVLGMNFYYTGSPSFTITHNGEPLEGRVQLNAQRGCLLFIGDNLTIETGSLVITCTGGTFGPFYGRVNEMPFAPNMASLQWIAENFTGNTKTFQHTGPNLGRVYGIVASAWWVNPPTTPPLDIKVTSRDFYGAGIGWTPGLDGFNWSWSGTEATHVGEVVNASRPSELDAQNAGPFRFRCDISDYTDPPTTTSVQYRDTSGLNGANAPLQRFGNVLSGLWSSTDPYKKFELRMGGDVKISNIRIYNATVNAPAICGVISSADNLSYWYYSSATNMPCAGISLKVAPLGDFNWQSITVTAGDSGDWFGYSNGDIAYPPFNPPVGSVTGQPTPLTELEALFQDSSGDIVAVFQGNWQTAMQSVGLTLDGQVLSPNGYSLQGGNTFLRFTGYVGSVTDGGSYTAVFG